MAPSDWVSLIRQIAFGSLPSTATGFDTDGTFLDKTSVDTLSQTAPSDSCGIAFSRGGKRYELSNHLGNVLAVISDRKLQVLDANMSLGHYFTADIWASTDYFPFGSQMRERTWKVEVYRFDFNGKETDLETALQDYGFRIYNPGIAKFLSVDPLASEYPWYTPYQFAGNKPIVFVDIDGLEEGEKKESNANPKLTHVFIFVIDPQSSHDDRRLYEMRMPKQGKWFIIGAGSALKAQEKLAEALEDNDQKTVTTIVFFSHGTHRGDRANIKLNPVSSLENNATNYFDIQVYLDKVNETDKEKAFDPNDATTFKKYEHESGYEISVEKFEQINAFAKIVQSTSAEGCFYLLSCDIGYDDKLMELIHNSWLKKIEATLTSAKAIVNIRLRFYEDGKAKNRFFGYGSNLIKGATKGLVKTIDGEGKKSKADNIQLDNRKGKSPIEVIGKSSG
jgi:RHS repeat-associated protein